METTLPSGAKLKVDLAPFAISNALYKVCLEEFKSLKFDPKAEIDINLFKDILCSAISSEKIEKALWECAKRATYNGFKISADVFEPEDAREDYMLAMYEIARVNIMPFTKGLYAQFAPLLGSLLKGQ